MDSYIIAGIVVWIVGGLFYVLRDIKKQALRDLKEGKDSKIGGETVMMDTVITTTF
jgi:predicted membrane channel-forming protein YqfA (hemolysin III family)